MLFNGIDYEMNIELRSCCSREATCEYYNSDSKKASKAKKPDENLVSLVFRG